MSCHQPSSSGSLAYPHAIPGPYSIFPSSHRALVRFHPSILLLEPDLLVRTPRSIFPAFLHLSSL
eukprot:761151-Hanusia_phi.AAC.1